MEAKNKIGSKFIQLTWIKPNFRVKDYDGYVSN